MTMLEKCSCNHCSGHIEFDSEHAGQMVVCPHCGLETQLFAPFNKKTAQSPSAVQNVSVEVKRVASPLGIASLVIGVIACVFCVTPLLAFWAIRLALIGVLLSLVGVAMSAKNKKTGFEYPISGGIVSLLSIVIALVMTDGFAVLTHKATSALQTFKESHSAFQQGDITVKMGDVVHEFTTKESESPTEHGLLVKEKTNNYLLIRVDMFNSSSNRICDFSTFRSNAVLTDNKGNYYRNLERFDNRDLNVTLVLQPTYRKEDEKVVHGWKPPPSQGDFFFADSKRVQPNTFWDDMLGYEMTDSPGTVLHLELSAENFGGTGKIKFEIPVSTIKNW